MINYSHTKLKSHAFKNIQKNQKMLKVSIIKKSIILIRTVDDLRKMASQIHIFLAAGRIMDHIKNTFVIKKRFIFIHMKMIYVQRLKKFK